jgi:hypothetical protein
MYLGVFGQLLHVTRLARKGGFVGAIGVTVSRGFRCTDARADFAALGLTLGLRPKVEYTGRSRATRYTD